MRLINTETLTLKEWIGSKAPAYAILSHTWGIEEVIFGDLNGPISDAVRAKAGFSKLEQFCRVAREEGYEWAWCDTYCINKDSSAELSEAINSMYKWYQDAHVCYVYLEDVRSDHFKAGLYPPPERWKMWEGSLEKSRWFTRGWTLQELVAPKNIYFYDVHWHCFASKRTIPETLFRITQIPVEVFTHPLFDPSEYCAAVKMSWAAKRETTRLEDRAYSLFGLFDINLPLLYGEGSKAFDRLQEAIFSRGQDVSLLARIEPGPGRGKRHGLFSYQFLAQSPDDFCVSNSESPPFESYTTLAKISPSRLGRLFGQLFVPKHPLLDNRAKMEQGMLLLYLAASRLQKESNGTEHYLASLSICIPSTRQLVCLHLHSAFLPERENPGHLPVIARSPAITLVSYDDVKDGKFKFYSTQFIVDGHPRYPPHNMPPPIDLLLQNLAGARCQPSGLIRLPGGYRSNAVIVELKYKGIIFCVAYKRDDCLPAQMALCLCAAKDGIEASGLYDYPAFDEVPTSDQDPSMCRKDVAWLELDKGIWCKAEHKISPTNLPQGRGRISKDRVSYKLMISVEEMHGVDADASLEIIQARRIDITEAEREGEVRLFQLGRNVFEPIDSETVFEL